MILIDLSQLAYPAFARPVGCMEGWQVSRNFSDYKRESYWTAALLIHKKLLSPKLQTFKYKSLYFRTSLYWHCMIFMSQINFTYLFLNFQSVTKARKEWAKFSDLHKPYTNSKIVIVESFIFSQYRYDMYIYTWAKVLYSRGLSSLSTRMDNRIIILLLIAFSRKSL